MDWDWFDEACDDLTHEIKNSKVKFESIYGIPRGGLVVAVRLSHLLDLPMIFDYQLIGPRTLVVDDIADSGGTLRNLYRVLSHLEPPRSATLFTTPWTEFKPTFFVAEKTDKDSWLIFPWEDGFEKDTVSKVNP